MQKNKVLFLVTSLNSGGIENYLLRYLNFDTESICYVLCKSGTGGQLEQNYINRIGKDNIVKLKIGLNVFAWIKLFQFIKREHIGAVCDFTGEMSGLTMLISYVAKVGIRITFYRHASIHFKTTFFRMVYFRWMLLLINRYSTRILSNSRAALDFFHSNWETSPSKFGIIYNGIDRNFVNTSFYGKKLRQQLGIPETAFVVGHTGRVNKAKNHKTILEVAQNVCKMNTRIHFLLVGNGTEHLEARNFKDRIHFLGFRTDIAELLSVMDMFYFPSITEGQPNSLIEAMVKGLAILASNIDSIKEAVPQTMVDMLVPPMDVRRAVELILLAERDRNYMESLKCKEWAVRHFDADELFGKLKKEI